MFPTKLELDILYAERLREAEQHRRARNMEPVPGPFARLFARLTATKARPAAPRDVEAFNKAVCEAVTSR